MNNDNFIIFGIDLGTERLDYIGWTRHTLGEKDEIVSELKRDSDLALAQEIEQAAGCDKISIFEIDSASSPENARETVQYWCRYYGLLGAKVQAISRC